MNSWINIYDDDDDEDIVPDFNLTDEVQKNCYHKWVITGYGPNNKDSEPWENCEKCGMKKEDYIEKKKPRARTSRFLF
jgi:hypothetical protein